MDMVALLRHYIRAKRTGDWYLHLATMKEMLPHFATTDHNNYTKSLRNFLQDMNNLKEKNPSIYKSFEDGQHVVRRNDRFWSGISLDQVIEQDLMRALKTSGILPQISLFRIAVAIFKYSGGVT